MTNTTVTKSEPKKWPIWVMAILAFITIGCWIVTICAPSIFRKFMDIILWIILFFSWLSWIINAFTNEQKYVWCLVSLWVLVMILGILLIFSSSEFIWTLTIRCFAIWALLRWCILIYYSLTNREEQKFWRWILTLWILLIILFFVIAFSDKSDAKTVAWICIWISTVFDWLCLLILSFRANEDPTLQDQILQQANQNEIAQDTTNTTTQATAPTQPNITTDNQSQQQSNEVKLWDTQQPTPVVEQPATPIIEQPAAPVVEQPAAPVVEQPATPVIEQPAAPVVEQPAAPVVEQPAAPETQQATPKVEQPNNENPA